MMRRQALRWLVEYQVQRPLLELLLLPAMISDAGIEHGLAGR